MGSKPVPLPHPQLVAITAARCPRCGYELAGLASIQNCPECGVRLGPDVVLRIFGLPKHTESRPWRCAMWPILITAGALLYFLGPILAMFIGCIGPVVLGTVVVGGCVYMAVTSRGRKTMTEQITFSWAGIGRQSWTQESAPLDLMSWPTEMYVQVSSVAPLWQKIIVEDHGPGARQRRYFECGFRCAREQLRWVQVAILALSRGEEISVEGEDGPSSGGPPPLPPVHPD